MENLCKFEDSKYVNNIKDWILSLDRKEILLGSRSAIFKIMFDTFDESVVKYEKHENDETVKTFSNHRNIRFLSRTNKKISKKKISKKEKSIKTNCVLDTLSTDPRLKRLINYSSKLYLTEYCMSYLAYSKIITPISAYLRVISKVLSSAHSKHSLYKLKN